MRDLTLDPERLTLHQADQARNDFAAISDELDFIKGQLARLPTRRDLARMAIATMVGGAGLAVIAIEALRW
jgi:hypothetical protein